MGFFSRKESATGSGSRSRSAMSSEAQAADLRARARRRLIGALALVLAAVIVVPALFDDPALSDMQAEPLIVVPMPVPGTPNPDATGVVASITPDAIAATPNNNLTEASPVPVDTVINDVNDLPPMDNAVVVADTPPESKADTKPVAPNETKPVTKPASERTDDGSVAIALLEGRTLGKPVNKAPVHGNFTLQIAAYTTDHDAQSRREKLITAGVTNAYVENATVNDKNTYRLRVGPFPSREAAQAAQARLRALGYDNSFISAK